VIVKPPIYVSPAEPGWLKRLLAEQFDVAVTKIVTEDRGVDVAWMHDQHGDATWFGVQRKELNDLIASIGDRLTREIPQMVAGVEHPHIIVEGRVSWSNEGVLMRDGWGQPFTKKQWRGLMWSIQGAGVGLSYSKDGPETVSLIRDMYAWTAKDRHTTLRQRANVPTNDWGTRDNGAWSRWVLQGFDGIGPEAATRIVRMYGLPLQWTVTKEELLAVEGLGKVKVDRLFKALEVSTDATMEVRL